MQEIVSVAQVERLWMVLAALSPLLGIGLGALRLKSRDRQGAWRTGMGIGLIGPGNLLLWRLYNGLTDRNGLDTVRNLEINLTVFLLIGVVIGVVLGRMERPVRSDTASAAPPSESAESSA